MATIHVVSGLAIRSDGWILMGKRKLTGLRGDLWELPGGKVDVGETPQVAVVREWQEELALEVVIASTPSDGGVLDLDDRFVLTLITVAPMSAAWPENLVPHAIDHQVLSWVDPVFAMKYMPCSPGYYLGYRAIRRMVDTYVTSRYPAEEIIRKRP